MFRYKLCEIDYGVKLLMVPDKNVETVFYSFLFDKTGGSVYRNKREEGLAHFLEHMMFKGTVNRPGLEIFSELDGIGAKYNAYTTKEHTAYYIKVLKEKSDLALDILFDILFNSVFDKSQIETERNVILEEYKMWEDDPLDNLFYTLSNLVYKGHPLSSPVIGRYENIKRFQRKDLLRYWEDNYSLENLIIIASGNIDFAETKKSVINYLKNIDKKSHIFKKTNISVSKPFSKQTRPRFGFYHKKINQINIGISYPVYFDEIENMDYIHTIPTVLGGNSSSRLFVELREKKGICYHVSSYFSRYRDIGTLNIYASIDIKNIYEVYDIILKQIEDIKNGGITQEEFKKSKDYIKGMVMMDLESPTSFANWYLNYLLNKEDLKSPAKWSSGLSKLKKSSIEKDASKIFNHNRVNIALVGDINEKNFDKIKRELIKKTKNAII